MDVRTAGKRLYTPRVALLANLGLVFTGSILALLGTIDYVSAAIMVLLGFTGVAITMIGRTSS